jgi:phage shock protein PspC (stress-responsive transcriptional regulator)
MGLIDNTTYTGKDTDGFFALALIKGTSKEQFKLVPNVKSKVKMASLNLSSGLIQEDDCDFTASGDATLAQKDLEVCPLKVNLELCTKDFETNYLSEKLRAGSNNNEIPATFQEFFLDQVAKNVSKELEMTVWIGNPDGSPVVGVCQGLLELFDADATVIDVSGTTLSASNIMAEIGKVYAAIPTAIRQAGIEKVKIFISFAAGTFFRQALIAAHPALVAANNGNFTLKYIDVDLIEVAGMPTNVMVACVPSENIWYGTDLLNDENQIKILDMSNTTGAETVRFITHFKFGVNYANGAEIVYYH